MTLFSKIKEQWKKVVFLEKTPESGEVILTQRRVFTLPSKAGLMFGIVLIVLFVTSINYNLNLGLAITYLLGGIVVINTFYSFRNLAYLICPQDQVILFLLVKSRSLFCTLTTQNH